MKIKLIIVCHVEISEDVKLDDMKMKVVKTVHYCKGLKQTGKPVIVANKHGSKNVRKWVWKGKDEDGTPIRMEIEFGNSDKNAKKRGATTVLKVYK